MALDRPTYAFELDQEALSLGIHDRQRQQLLLESNSPNLLMPAFHEHTLNPTVQAIETDGARTSIRFLAAGVANLRVEMTVRPDLDAIDLRSSCTATEELILNRLDVLPGGTKLNFYNCINFRNRHGTAETWPELLLARAGFTTSTYSDDWQFAPHPTILGFTKLDTALFVGALDLPQAFGLQLKASNYQVDACYLDYGEGEHGLRLAPGDSFSSPTFRIYARRGLDPYQMYAEFGKMLVAEQRIPDPADKPREAWWQAPLYCTWIDQCFEAEGMPAPDLAEQTAESALPTRTVFTEQMVRDAVEVIKREKLPFKTILLDEGWHVGRGHWEPHQDRFPDLRKLVDDLHADGFKVVVWWNWVEIEKAVEHLVAQDQLLAGGKRNKHGCILRDYSAAATQAYLADLFHTLFSSDEGCYDLDGVKTDFQADKVHPDLPPANPAWRGEEMTFYQVYKLFYAEMKRHKPDAVHIGCAGNYWLAEFIDINRTYDIFSSNYVEHANRARMLMATAPGCPVAYDFHNHVENLAAYLESARELGASIQIGNLLKTRQDVHHDPAPATDAYYEILREYWR